MRNIISNKKVKVIADNGSPALPWNGGTWYLVVQKGDRPRAHRAKYDKVFEIDEDIYAKAFDDSVNLVKKSLVIGLKQGQWHILLGGEDTGRTAIEI